MPQPVHLLMKQEDVSPAVITAGDPARVKQLANILKDARLVNENRGLLAYTGYYNGKKITVATQGIGGPASAIVFEELLMLGAKTIVRLGTCGAMVPGLNIGDFMIPSGAAYYYEGSLRMYIPDGVIPAVPDFQLTTRLVKRCKDARAKYETGIVVSTDAFYAEGPDFVTKWTSRGVIAVEMECATLFVLGIIKGFKTAALLIVTENSVNESQKVMVSSKSIANQVDLAGRIILDTLTTESV
jgi:5'-methylthioadenosine phosphorylase